MLIFPDQSLAIFDSTAPHEHFPVRDGDSILDLYELAVTKGTDEKHAAEMDEIAVRYRAAMKEATSYLAQAKVLQDQLEQIFLATADDTTLSDLRVSLLKDIEVFVV